MNDKLKINLIIAGSSHTLFIRPEEEELIRKAAKLIEIKLANYTGRLGADKNENPTGFSEYDGIGIIICISKNERITGCGYVSPIN